MRDKIIILLFPRVFAILLAESQIAMCDKLDVF